MIDRRCCQFHAMSAFVDVENAAEVAEYETDRLPLHLQDLAGVTFGVKGLLLKAHHIVFPVLLVLLLF